MHWQQRIREVHRQVKALQPLQAHAVVVGRRLVFRIGLRRLLIALRGVGESPDLELDMA